VLGEGKAFVSMLESLDNRLIAHTQRLSSFEVMINLRRKADINGYYVFNGLVDGPARGIGERRRTLEGSIMISDHGLVSFVLAAQVVQVLSGRREGLVLFVTLYALELSCLQPSPLVVRLRRRRRLCLWHCLLSKRETCKGRCVGESKTKPARRKHDSQETRLGALVTRLAWDRVRHREDASRNHHSLKLNVLAQEA
jgi:hypothetical protein